MLTMQFSHFLDIFAIPFGYVMQGLNFISGGHYLLSLFLFALIVKLLTLPLSIKQQKTQIKTAMLRPKMMLIEKKYAGRTDRATLQKKQQEMMALQQQEGISVMSGCLPLLIQFPIILGLYRIIRMPLKYVCGLADTAIITLYNSLGMDQRVSGAPATIDKLSGSESYQIAMVEPLKQSPELLESVGSSVDKLPNFSLFGKIDLGLKPGFTPDDKINLLLLLIPAFCCIFAFLSMWVNRKLNNTGLNPAAGDQKSSMMVMNLMMPLMSLWIAFITPAAVGVYWVYTSVLGILQTILLAKFMPLPRYTEEQIREMQRAAKQGQQNQGRNIVSARVDENGKPKSLHYSDDNDEY